MTRHTVRFASLGLFGAALLLGGCGGLHHRGKVPPAPRSIRDGGAGFHADPHAMNPPSMGQAPTSGPAGLGNYGTGAPIGAGPGNVDVGNAPFGGAPMGEPSAGVPSNPPSLGGAPAQP